MTREGLIEVMARAIYERNPASVSEGAVCWAEALEDWPEHVREARKDATAALAAIEAAGVRLDDGWRDISELPLMDHGGTTDRSAIDALVVIEDMVTGHRRTTFLYQGDDLMSAYKLFQRLPAPPAQKDESHD